MREQTFAALTQAVTDEHQARGIDARIPLTRVAKGQTSPPARYILVVVPSNNGIVIVKFSP